MFQIELNVLVSVQKSNYDWATRPGLGHALASEHSIFQRQIARVYNCIAPMNALTEKSMTSFVHPMTLVQLECTMSLG